MTDEKRYKIIYTSDAEEDLFSKAEYVEKVFRDSGLAYTWYIRLRSEIEQDLSFLPYKYRLYDVSPWREQGVRIYLYRNDIVLYTVHDDILTVVIHAVFTKGKGLSEDVLG